MHEQILARLLWFYRQFGREVLFEHAGAPLQTVVLERKTDGQILA